MFNLSRPSRAVRALTASAATIALVSGMPALAATDGSRIGTAAAARPGVTGTPPQQEKRVIEVGTNLLADERIVTAPNAQAQILFNDGSSFSVGPDSDIVIDKFVYDPGTGNGEMSLSVGKGVFRFVGGKISKNSEVQVRTPTATMGIRGGIATLSVQPGQPVVGKFLFGKSMTMAQNGITQTTNRPGTVIEAPPGAPPSPPRPATPAEIRQTMSQLEAAPAAAPAAPAAGGGGDSGGGGQQQQVAAAPAPAPIESQMESSGISQGNSSVAPAAVTVTPTTTASPAAPTPAPAPTPTVVVNPDPTPVTPPTPTTVTATFEAVRGRTLLQGLGVQPFNANSTPGLTATQNGTASIGVSGLTTTTTAGVGTWNLALPGNAGTVNLALPITSGSSFGTGSLFNVSQGVALNAVASIATAAGSGLTGIKYEGYFNDNLNFFNSASVQFDSRFVNPFTAINTTTPGANFDETYSVRFFGFFRPTETGTYNFGMSSDDASYLWLGNADESVASLEARRGFTGGSGLVVNNGGLHPVVTRTGSTGPLQAGEDYPILVYFGENFGGDRITVDFRLPSSDSAFTNNGEGFFFSTGSGSSSTQVSFAGTTLSGFGYRAENASDFLFYSLASATPTTDFSPEALADIVRLTHYEGTPTAAVNFPTAGFGTHQAFGQFGFDSVPFIGDHLVSPAHFSASPIISRYDANISAANFGDDDARSVLMQGTLGIFGQGAGQVSYLTGMTGIYLEDPASGQVTASGGMHGSARLDAEGRPVSFSSNVGAAETTTGGSAVFGSSGQFMVFTPDQISFNTGTGEITRTTGVTLVEPLATNKPVNELALTVGVSVEPGPLTTATSRTSRSITGYASGLMETRFDDGSLASSDTIIDTGAVLITTNATTNRLVASFQLGIGGGSTELGFGSVSGAGTNSAFINDSLFAAREAFSSGEGTTTRAIMISHDVVPIQASAFAPAGVDFCDCPFMQWGWWASNVSSGGRGEGSATRNVVHLATWVAGELANIVDIPVAGTATYSGHAIGNVNNNGARYIAMGNFSQNWNFATRTGVATISNFDSLTVSLNTASGNGRDFSSTGLAAGTSAAVTGAGVAGSFYRAPTDVAGVAPSGAAGQFAITATGNYQAAGTFVAKK